MMVDFKPIITMVSYVIQAANYGKDVIRMVSDDCRCVCPTGLLGSYTEQHCSIRSMEWNSTRHQCNLY